MLQSDEAVQVAVGACKGLDFRLCRDDVQRQAERFRDSALVALLDSVTDIVLVLNGQRQIVFVNHNLLDLLQLDDAATLIGVRPGELFRCEHVCERTGGCGTGEACTHCGALRAILHAVGGVKSTQECRITQRVGTGLVAYDLKVCATPFAVQGEDYVIFALHDISHEKRRKQLERIFFHDILNTAGGLRNLTQLLLDEAPQSIRSETALLHEVSSVLVEEIQSHRLLLAAESNELCVRPESIDVVDLMHTVAGMYRHHDVASGKEISVLHSASGKAVVTDRMLLSRVLANMVKNALEAECKGATIYLQCIGDESGVTLLVRNPTAMPAAVQRQVFQRSFSTKGVGRGLGTYSIRLLTTTYLGGDVAFASTDAGTEFRVRLPLHIQAAGGGSAA